MERPSRRNLFDDSEEEDEEKEYQPKLETEEVPIGGAEPAMAEAAEEPVEAQAAVEEEKEEGAIALNQQVRVNQFIADLQPSENDLAKNLDDEDDEEYVPQAEPERPVVVAQEPQMEEVDVSEPIEEQKPEPVVEESPEQAQTNAEKKLKEEAEIAKNQLLKEIKGFHIDDAEH